MSDANKLGAAREMLLLSKIRTHILGFVTAIKDGLASVQPTRKLRYSDGRPTADAAPCSDVPIAQPVRGGGWAVTVPHADGDQVLLMVVDREIETWAASDGATTVEPGPARYHSLADCIALPGVSPKPAPVDPDAMLVGREDGEVVLRLGRKELQLKAGASTIRIDATGVVTVDIEAGAELRLGETATRGVARQADVVAPNETFAAWIASVAGITGQPFAPGPIGTITTSSGRVKSE